MVFRRLLLLLSPSRRRRRAAELEEELRASLALAEEEAAAAGLPREDATRAARREIGNLTLAHEEARAVWFPGWDQLAQIVRYALRGYWRNPGFTAVAVLSLALGIGSATALFSLVDGVVLKPLAYRDSGRLVLAREIVPSLAHLYPTLPANIRHFRFWRQEARSFTSLAAMVVDRSVITTGEPERIDGAAVTAGLCEMLGIEPQLGRCFAPDEETEGRRVVVITDSLWRRRFDGDREVVGKTLVLDGAAHTVIGVLPSSFRFPKRDDLGQLAGLGLRTEFFRPIADPGFGWSGDYDYIVIGRLRPGVSAHQANAELDLLERRMAVEQGMTYTPRTRVLGLQDVVSSPVRTELGVLLAAVLVLLLIVCVNLANLLLARGSARTREYALRVAIGAGRGRLLAHALVETLMLSMAGGILGVVGARFAVTAVAASSRIRLPRLDEVQVDGRVMLFGFALSVLAALLFGLLPAARLAGVDPQQALRSGSQTLTTGRRGLRTREWLVGGEVALSALLLALAGLLINSLTHVLRVDKGFRDENAVLVTVGLPAAYRTAEQRTGFFDTAVERLRAVPGVRSAAYISLPPLSGESNVNQIRVEGSEAVDPVTREHLIVNVRFVGPEYFASLGIPLIKGRVIEPGDRDRNVAVVSARLAAKLFPNGNPLGHTITTGSRVGNAEIVGVVGDIHTSKLENAPTMMVYSPYWKVGFASGTIALRTGGNTQDAMAQARSVLRALEPSLPPVTVRAAEALVTEATAQRRFQIDVAGAFAASALLLALLGIYGVVSYSVSLRRREMGVRLALGAGRGDLRRMVVVEGLRPVAAGLAVGLLLAMGTGRLVRTLLFGITPTDGPTLAAVAAVLACVAAIACLAPAYSAARMDPAQVLRED